ncbi:MAG: alanine racemase [Patescibacteria group bacterium]
MPNPRLSVNLEAVAANTAEVVRRAAAAGVTVAGVTKACCGAPQVARAMLAGGAVMLADSRLENLAGLRRAGLGRVPLMLLRLPMPSRAAEAAELADLILVSEPETARLLGAAGRGVRLVLMADLGDLREGLWPDRIPAAAAEMAAMRGVELAGLGANLTCFGGIKPTPANLGLLLEMAAAIRKAVSLPLPLVSGGNTSSLPLLWEGVLPPGINHLRIGEGILLGVETIARRPLPGLRQDGFCLAAEVIEVQRKPSVPLGVICQDAFGRVPHFPDRGWERRAILALGRQDCVPEGLRPLREGIEILGASSDHLILADRAGLAVGEEVQFIPSYGALLAAMTSPYVYKEYHGG